MDGASVDGGIEGIDDVIGDGLGLAVGVESALKVGVDGNGQTAAQAGHRAYIDDPVTGKLLLDAEDGLIHFLLLEVRGEGGSSGSDGGLWRAGEYVREGWSADVCGLEEVVEIAGGGAGLGESGEEGCVVDAAVVEAASKAEYGALMRLPG